MLWNDMILTGGLEERYYPPLFLNTPSLPPFAVLSIPLSDPKINTPRLHENVYQILPVTSFNLKLGTITDG